jgi:hypothetical protein
MKWTDADALHGVAAVASHLGLVVKKV